MVGVRIVLGVACMQLPRQLLVRVRLDAQRLVDAEHLEEVGQVAALQRAVGAVEVGADARADGRLVHTRLEVVFEGAAVGTQLRWPIRMGTY